MNGQGAAREWSCPYGCSGRHPFDPAKNWCVGCDGWVKFCSSQSCSTANRMFARHCRTCRAKLPAWEVWACAGGNPCGSGRCAQPAPWRDLRRFNVSRPWKGAGLDLGAEVGPRCAVACCGALVAFTKRGDLVMADLRSGREIHRTTIDEEPVSLFASGECVAVVTSERFRFYSVLGPGQENYSSPVATGFRRLWEKQVPEPFTRFVHHPIPYGPHLVVPVAGPGAFGLVCLRLDTREDLWTGNDIKTYAGDPAFISPVGDSRLVVGSTDGAVVELTGLRGNELARFKLEGGLLATFQRACVDSGRLYFFNSLGKLCCVELSGSRPAEPVGAIEFQRPSLLGVSPNEIVAGDRAGQLVRFNCFGTVRRDYQLRPEVGAAGDGFSLQPLLTDDGSLLAVSDTGRVLFGASRTGDEPIEKALAFQSSAQVTSFLFVQSTFVAINGKGEVQALRVTPGPEEVGS